MTPLTACCQREADKSLRKHRHVARCDQCDKLLLAYGTEVDYDRTLAELTDNEVAFEVGASGKLRVIAYRR